MKQNEIVNSRTLNIIIFIFSLGILLYLASYGFLLWETPGRLVLIFIPLVLVLWSLFKIRDGNLFPKIGGKWNLLLCIICIAISAYSAYYFYTEYPELLFQRAANNNLTDYIIGGLVLFLVVLATWRETGRSIPIVLVVFIAYAFLGKYFPSGNILHHAGITFPAFMSFSVLLVGGSSAAGIFGTFAIAGFTLVIIFLYFAGLVQGFGGLAFIINISKRMTRRFSWGLPQIPVISSMFFGSFSGAAAANVAGTGSFTIPMMKRFGVPSKVAGAIESVASTGGQIMPPVMGVAAFLMAEFLGIPYIKVVAYGIAPALLFYISCAFAVYLSTKDMLISRLPRAQREELAGDFHYIDGLPIAVSLLFLMYLLAVRGSSVLVSGLWAVIGLIITQLLLNMYHSRFSLSTLSKFVQDMASGIQSGAGSVVQIIGLLCTIGVVAKMLVITGLTQKLSFLMIDLSGGHLFILLPLIFIVCILFGMAVSTAVVYILVVILAAPVLQTYGVAPHVAHFTVFYMSILSSITPPVAIAVAVACNIAKASFFSTAWTAMRIGLPLFILPFVFLFKPHILAFDLTTPLAFLQTLVGFLAITYGMNSGSGGMKGYVMRVLLFVVGAIAIFSTAEFVVWPSLIAVLVLGALVFLAKRRANVNIADSDTRL